MMIANGSTLVVVARITANCVFTSPIWRKMTNIGVTSSGGGNTCTAMIATTIAAVQNVRMRASA